ncbi:MAG: hypothetical protein PHC95_05585 [Parabacteroides sp.]|nr:hypothetical protein [Parabacteroides sp.]
MKNQDVQFQIECLTIELAHLLMAEYGWDMNRALDELYNSSTYRKMEDERSGLYYQSTLYVFQYLKNEMETGVMA